MFCRVDCITVECFVELTVMIALRAFLQGLGALISHYYYYIFVVSFSSCSDYFWRKTSYPGSTCCLWQGSVRANSTQVGCIRANSTQVGCIRAQHSPNGTPAFVHVPIYRSMPLLTTENTSWVVHRCSPWSPNVALEKVSDFKNNGMVWHPPIEKHWWLTLNYFIYCF